MRRAEFIALSACSMMLTALGIDIMLPVFGHIRNYFNLPPESTAAAQIVVFFFLGQIAQVVFGALSDRYGRLPILRIGFPLYIIGGVVASVAPTLGVMYAARFVAGAGASAVMMATIAGVRDRFVGNEMARVMSLIFTIFLSTPVYAPFLGIGILSIASWRMVFLTPPLFAILVFTWSLRMEESLPRHKRSSLRMTDVFTSAGKVLGNRIFLRYTAISTFLFAGLSSWVSSSEHIVGEIYKIPQAFTWIFAGMGIWMAVSTLTNSRLAYRYGAKRTLQWLLLVYTIIATVLLILSITFGCPPHIFIFVISVGLLLGINLAIEPNSSALAMEPMGEMAGLASSIYGTLFFFVGAAIGSGISILMKESVFPLVLSFFLIGLITLWIGFRDPRT